MQQYVCRSQNYSITSSAVASRVDGTSRPSVRAVLRLSTSSYLVGACTGRSAGFSPLRMRSTYSAACRYCAMKSRLAGLQAAAPGHDAGRLRAGEASKHDIRTIRIGTAAAGPLCRATAGLLQGVHCAPIASPRYRPAPRSRRPGDSAITPKRVITALSARSRQWTTTSPCRSACRAGS
jgi:hypothetical protein